MTPRMMTRICSCRHANTNYGEIRTQDPSHFFVMSDEALVVLPRQGLGLGKVAEGLGRAQDSFGPGSGMLEARRASGGIWGFNVQTYATMCAMLREKADELNRELLTRCVARSASPLCFVSLRVLVFPITRKSIRWL